MNIVLIVGQNKTTHFFLFQIKANFIVLIFPFSEANRKLHDTNDDLRAVLEVTTLNLPVDHYFLSCFNFAC